MSIVPVSLASAQCQGRSSTLMWRWPTRGNTMLTSTAIAQSAQDVRGRTPFIPVGTEPPAQLIVDPPSPLALSVGVVLIQYRAENVHIVPVFGPSVAATMVANVLVNEFIAIPPLIGLRTYWLK